MKRMIAALLAAILFTVTVAQAQINPTDIDIVRDKWGVPHIYGKTDADAAYGLAWATSEDDFKTIQELLLAVRGRLAEVNGKDGAILDFMSFICGADRVVNAQYDTAYSPEYKKVLEAYVAGINAYATAHPEEVLRKGLFPISGKDIIKEFVLTNSLLTSVYLDIQKIFVGEIKHYDVNFPSGSNGFAFNGKKTTDGKTYLDVNSHQPLEGLFSWYEAHINSEEGLNMLGGTFPGGISIFLGTNENLGWACTLNHPDMDDVYELQMNPNNKLQYWMDDHWETLEVRKMTDHVKVGFLRLPITKTFYWSKYGTTLKGKDGHFYSIRFPANMDIRSPEQLYHMNKAKNFTEWRNVMRTNSIPGMNFIYADRQDNIFYASTSMQPYRNPKYDWLKVLPGNTSATLWPAKFHPFDSIPQLLNPNSGFLLNTNNTCFDVTGYGLSQQEYLANTNNAYFEVPGTGDNLNPNDYPKTMGYGLEENNRSIMAHYLISKHDKVSYEDFKEIKFNRMFNDSMYDYIVENLLDMWKLDPKKYPDLADAIEVLQSWNHSTDVNNKEAALAGFAIYHLVDKINAKGRIYDYNSFPESTYVEALRASKKHMLKYFGSLRVPLGDVQKHVRGDVALPVGGGPEVIAATITQPWKDGMRKTAVGESYIQLVRYSKDSVQIESINAYGSSAKPGSPHYTDQMEMYVHQQLKPMTLDKASIYQNAEKIYHPIKGGQEPQDLTRK